MKAEVWVALAGALIVAGSSAARDLVVSPGGLSPQAALEKIRAAKARGDKSAWTVRVKGGLYTLAKPLVLTPADSGTSAAPVRWVGERGRSVFAGGSAIGGWRNDGDGVWSAPLPTRPDGKPAFFEQLWVNGRRADRARMPDRGFWRISSPSCTQQGDRFVERFALEGLKAGGGGLPPPEELKYAQACLVQNWTFARRIVRDFTPSNGVVTTWAPTAFPNYAKWTKGMPCWFENVRAGFDAPGEWFYDAAAKRVRYRPLPGEDMRALTVVAPTAGLSRLVVVAGDAEKGEFVHDIRFEGLTFACTASKTILTAVVEKDLAKRGARWTIGDGPTESWQYQAAQSSDAAITVEGGHRLAWTDCTVRNTANYAFRFNDGCVSNAVVGCTLEDLGAGGVWMGARGTYRPAGRRATAWNEGQGARATAFNLVSNCVIRTGGRFNPEGTGVALTHASDCRIVCNTITNFYYTGVSVGWVWGYGGSIAQRNEIAYNRIGDLGRNLMSDMGGIYTLGTSFGTRVHHNIVHDVNSLNYGGWGLYADEGSEGVVFEENLVWNTRDGGFHQHYGVGNAVRNNIFAWNRTAGVVRITLAEKAGVRCGFDFVNNIVYTQKGQLAGGKLLEIGGTWEKNLWFAPWGGTFPDNRDWRGWCGTGRETGGVYADPKFMDAKRNDFRLKEDSPAFALGFKPWDWSKAGARIPKED